MLPQCKHTCARAAGIDVKPTTLIREHHQISRQESAARLLSVLPATCEVIFFLTADVLLLLTHPHGRCCRL